MTISTTTNRTEADGNDVTTEFQFPYYFLDETDLKVYLDDTLQTLTTHYTVTGEGVASGGAVHMVTAPATGETLTILRDPPITQTTDWVENDPDSAAVKERAYDKLTMIAQRLQDQIGRSMVLADSESTSVSTVLPSPSDGKMLGWSVVGGNTSIVNITAGDDYIPIQASEPDETVYVLWYDTSAEALKYWDGAAWAAAAADITGKQSKDADAVNDNVAIFASTETVDSGVALTDLATDAEVATAVAPKLGYDNFLHIEEQQTSGTHAGASTTYTSFKKRELNTVVVNNIAGATLSANQIILPEGTYYVEASAPAWACNAHVTRIYDTTGSAVKLSGESSYIGTSVSAITLSKVSGIMSLDAHATTNAIELQHKLHTSTASLWGMGLATNLGVENELYSWVKIWKVAS